MSTTMTASEARAALPRILDMVEQGEELTITRHGRPIAVIVRPDSLSARRASRALDDAARIADLLEASRGRPLADAPTIGAERAEELLAEVRAGRSAR